LSGQSAGKNNREDREMNPFIWLIWINERMSHALRPPRRKPVLRVIEGGRKHGSASPRANATGLRRPVVR
jgi:hypothetical protein